MSSSRNLFVLIAVLVDLVNASLVDKLPERRVAASCLPVESIVKYVEDDSRATEFCTAFLEIPVVTKIHTTKSTITLFSSTTTTVVTTSEEAIIEPATVTINRITTITTKITSTITQGLQTITASPVTITTTSNRIASVCVAALQSKLARMSNSPAKPEVRGDLRQQILITRDSEEERTELEVLRDLQPEVASSVCSCLSLPTPTITMTKTFISTANKKTTFSVTSTAYRTRKVPLTSTVTSTSTILSIITALETTVASVVTYVPTITVTSSGTKTSDSSFQIKPTPDLLGRYAKTGPPWLDYDSGRPVIFSNESSATNFTLDEDGNLFDQSDMAFVHYMPGSGYAPVVFRPYNDTTDDYPLVCATDGEFLKCRGRNTANYAVQLCVASDGNQQLWIVGRGSTGANCTDAQYEVVSPE